VWCDGLTGGERGTERTKKGEKERIRKGRKKKEKK
jgi:hypothetical protein